MHDAEITCGGEERTGDMTLAGPELGPARTSPGRVCECVCVSKTETRGHGSHCSLQHCSLSLAESDHVTWILSSDWRRHGSHCSVSSCRLRR